MPIKTFSILIAVLFTGQLMAQTGSRALKVLEGGEVVKIPDSVSVQMEEGENEREPLLKWYTARGYLNATVDSVNKQRIYVTRGCEFILEKLSVSYSGEIDSLLLLNDLGKYSESKIESEIRKITYALEDEGYPFVKAEITWFEPSFEDCRVSAHLSVETGSQVSAVGIYFNGAQSNSQSYLRKVSRFRESITITPQYLRFLKTNLNSTELFNRVSDPEIVLKEGEPVIIFNVEERSLNQFDGLLGYVPDASGQGQVVGDVELSLWNVLAQGSGLEFQYQRLRPETSQLNLGASQDWIADIPVGLSIGFQLYQNDTTYQTREFNFDGYYRLLPGFKLKGGVGIQSSTSGSNIPVVTEPDGRKRTGRFGFEYANLDNYDVPTSGSSFDVSLGIAKKDLDEDSASAFTQRFLHLEARNYIPLFEKSVIATSLHGFLLDAQKATISDLVRFGGANSLRGYAEDQFRAGKMLWGDIEYRYLLNRRSFLFLFGAAGGYERPTLLTESDNSFAVIDYLYSTGLGLSYQTRIGRLKFTYAVSPRESIGNGKVHFGIRTEL